MKANRGEAGPEWTDAAISAALEVGPTTVARVRKLHLTEGLEAALQRKAPNRVYRRQLDGEQEVRLVAVSCSEPLRGWRAVMVSVRRTRIDWARAARTWSMSTIPTPRRSSWSRATSTPSPRPPGYEAFPPAEAKPLADKLELHYTPKHGSWLKMAGIELGIQAGQCLDRRLPDRVNIDQEVAAWAPPALPPSRPSTGASPPTTRGSNSTTSTLCFTTDESLASF